MTKSKMIALVVTAALAAALALVGCGGSQASSASASSAASSAAASSAAASTAASSAASTAASSAAASSAAASSAAASSAAAPASSAAASSASDIGKDAAKEIALQHAGVAEADCIELKIELDTDDAVIHYDVDFKAGGQEYDYDINPETGEIIKYDSEIDD